MRVIACMGVIIIHITATGVTDYPRGSFPNILMIFMNRSLQYVTPLFIFLSGVTSFYSMGDKKFNYFDFIKRRISKIFIPYFIWCVIYYLSYVAIGYYSFNILQFVKKVVAGSLSYHLYFVIIIIQLYILAPIFYYSLKNNERKIPLLILFAVITALCIEFIRFKLSNRIFLKYMFFYMLGIYVSLEYKKYVSWLKKHSTAIAIINLFFCLAYIAAYYYNNIYYSYIWFSFCTTSILFVYSVCLMLSEKTDGIYSFIKLFGQSSYYIYLIHPLILTALIKTAEYKNITSVTLRLIIYTIVVIPSTVTASLLYSHLKNKYKERLKAEKNAIGTSIN